LLELFLCFLKNHLNQSNKVLSIVLLMCVFPLFKMPQRVLGLFFAYYLFTGLKPVQQRLLFVRRLIYRI
jgi:hypothetical protein